MNQDINISLKFANYLKDNGMLGSLSDSYRSYRDAENYPFELKDRRIIKQALAKPYAEILAQIIMSEEPKDVEKMFRKRKQLILDEIEVDANIIYGKKPLTIGEELSMRDSELAKKDVEIKRLEDKIKLLDVEKKVETKKEIIKKEETIPIIKKDDQNN